MFTSVQWVKVSLCCALKIIKIDGRITKLHSVKKMARFLRHSVHVRLQSRHAHTVIITIKTAVIKTAEV